MASLSPVTFYSPVCPSFPPTLVLCSPFCQNSEVNFINVGVEQMLNVIQDFVFVFVFLNFVVTSLSSSSYAQNIVCNFH